MVLELIVRNRNGMHCTGQMVWNEARKIYLCPLLVLEQLNQRPERNLAKERLVIAEYVEYDVKYGQG
jgi:hypothetical protein